MIQILVLATGLFFSKILRKLLYIVIFLAGCGVVFYYTIYPKIMENENMKYAVEYFKFWHKLPDEKAGTVTFLSDSLAKNNGDYKVAIGLKLLKYKKMNNDEAVKFLEELKNTKNKSKLTDNIINIKLSNICEEKDYKKSIKYLDKISSSDPLFVYAKEEKMRILLKRTNEFKKIVKLNKDLESYYNNINFYPYYGKIESFIEARSR